MIALLAILAPMAYAVWVVLHGARRGVYRYHLIRTPWFRVFLHHVDAPDNDRHMHNHPWPNAAAFVLWGGYLEQRRIDGQWKGRNWIVNEVQRWHWNRLYPWTYHRITEVKPCTWTLFFAGRRTRSWGFLTPRGHVDWKTYLGVPEGTELGD